MGVTFSIEDIEQRLISMGKKLQNQAIDEILEAGAEPVIKEMEDNVPVDTSELQGTIGVIKKEGSGVKRKIHLGSTSDDREIIERAYYQEHGHSTMMGKKWMKKSYQNTADKVKDIIAEKLKENIMR